MHSAESSFSNIIHTNLHKNKEHFNYFINGKNTLEKKYLFLVNQINSLYFTLKMP